MFMLTLSKAGALQLLYIFNEHGFAAQEPHLELIKKVTSDLRSVVLNKQGAEMSVHYSKEQVLDILLFLNEFSTASRPDKAPHASIISAMSLMEAYLDGGE